jgi:hypothetical protein
MGRPASGCSAFAHDDFMRVLAPAARIMTAVFGFVMED